MKEFEDLLKKFRRESDETLSIAVGITASGEIYYEIWSGKESKAWTFTSMEDLEAFVLKRK